MYGYEIWWNYSEMNSVRNANKRKLMTSLPDLRYHFKFGNLMKNAIFRQKNDCFHHLLEQIWTFIHRKPKLTFGKNMIATGHITAIAKMNPSYFPGGTKVHSFHHSSEQISLPHYTVPQVPVFYVAWNIDETLTYNSVWVTTPNFICSYYFLRKIWENPWKLALHTKNQYLFIVNQN